jgi:Ca2+/Na+ antiporter
MLIMLNNLLSKALIVTTTQLTMILIAVASIFLVFILVAIVKMYKLKSENKKLMETNAFKDVDESYKDFTSGHLYSDNQ